MRAERLALYHRPLAVSGQRACGHKLLRSRLRSTPGWLWARPAAGFVITVAPWTNRWGPSPKGRYAVAHLPAYVIKRRPPRPVHSDWHCARL